MRASSAKTGWSIGGAPLGIALTALLIVVAAALPVAYLFVRGFGGGAETLEWLLQPRSAVVLLRTLATIAGVTAVSMIVAVPAAWLTMRTDMPFRRVVAVALALPLVVPSFVMATTLIEALGPHGILQRWLEPLGVQQLPDIYGIEGATLVLVLMCYPYIYLSVRGALAGLNPELRDACRAMGYGAVETFRRVTLPLLMPSIGSGAILAALYTLSDFGGVALMRHNTLTVSIMTNYQTAVDRTSGAAMSMVLAIFVIGLLLFESLWRNSNARYDDLGSGTTRSARPAALGWWKWPALALAMLPVAVGLILPVAVLFDWLIGGITRGQELISVWQPTYNSLQASLLAALATIVVAFPVAILTVRYRSRLAALIERTTYIGFGLPGVVVAFSLVFFAVNFVRFVYQSMWLLVFAYVVLFLPVAVGALRSGLMQVSPRLEEAARSLGFKQWQVLLRVTIPILAPSIFAGSAIVFLLTMKELPATLILGPTGYDTLATSIWSSASEAFFTRTALASLILVFAAGVPTAWLVLRDRPGAIRDTGH